MLISEVNMTSDNVMSLNSTFNHNSTHHLTVETSYVYELLLYVLGVPLALFIFAINTVLIIVVAKNVSLQLKAVNVIVSWTIADFIMAAMLLSRIIVGASLWSYEDHQHWCHAWNALFLFPLISSFTHVLILALCRYAAVTVAVYYEDHLPNSKLRSYIAGCWFYGLVISLIPLIWFNNPDPTLEWPCSMYLLPRGLIAVLLGSHFLPCLCIAAFLFGRVFLSVSRHKRQVHVTSTISEQKLDENVQLARTFMYMCALYFFCWSPYLVVQMVWIIKGPTEIIQITNLVCLYVGMCASALKPFVWTFRHAHVRAAVRALFHRDRHIHTIVVTRACASC